MTLPYNVPKYRNLISTYYWTKMRKIFQELLNFRSNKASLKKSKVVK